MDSALMIDSELVTESVRTLALNTLTAYQSGVSLKWNDAELAVYLVYIFGEINKCEQFVISASIRSELTVAGSWRQGKSSVLSSSPHHRERKAKRGRLFRISPH